VLCGVAISWTRTRANPDRLLCQALVKGRPSLDVAITSAVSTVTLVLSRGLVLDQWLFTQLIRFRVQLMCINPGVIRDSGLGLVEPVDLQLDGGRFALILNHLHTSVDSLDSALFDGLHVRRLQVNRFDCVIAVTVGHYKSTWD
jgi:hypothetical protein